MTELKPCPFCGCGDAGIVRTKTIFDHVLGFMVLCPDCGGTVGFNTDTEFTAFTDFGTEQEAIDAWNTRAELRAYALSCGHEFDWNDEEPPAYCPDCGAKVVEG